MELIHLLKICQTNKKGNIAYLQMNSRHTPNERKEFEDDQNKAKDVFSEQKLAVPKSYWQLCTYCHFQAESMKKCKTLDSRARQ